MGYFWQLRGNPGSTGRIKMKETTSFSELAIKAMYRASRIAQQIAAEKNLKLPIWKDGGVTYIDSKKILTKDCSWVFLLVIRVIGCSNTDQ